jgi:hypothetical protein
MKRIISFTIAMSIVACGAETKPTSQFAGSGEPAKASGEGAVSYSIAVNSDGDLPSCGSSNQNQLAYVRGTKKFKSCSDGSWVEVEMDSSKNSLITTSDEPAGSNCKFGGKAVKSGVDKDGNGVLDSDEVSATSYVCDGASGSDGKSGANGKDGSDNKIKKAFSCQGTLSQASASAAGLTVPAGGLDIMYAVAETTSGDVFASGSVADSSFQASDAQFYSGSAVGSETAPVLITNDFMGGLTYGYWKISLNRTTSVVMVDYIDSVTKS